MGGPRKIPHPGLHKDPLSSIAASLLQTASSPFLACLLASGLIPCQSMFARLSQLSRHLYRPSTFVPAATNPLSSSFSPLRPSTMTSPAIVNATKTIHTAACLIIGDEVLGGKVSSNMGVKGHRGAEALD